MKEPFGDRARDRARLLRLSAVALTGRKYWVAALLPLIWPALMLLIWLVRWRGNDFSPGEVLPFLLGLPLAVLGIGLGIQVIAGEISKRTIEVAYTVPGGAARLWAYKLAAALVLLLAAELLAALFISVTMTPFPLEVLLGAFLAATFYLALSMWLAAQFRSEIAGAMASVALLALGAVGALTRISPFFNPVIYADSTEYSAEQVIAWTVQSRIGVALVTAALLAMAFSRAEQREKILQG